MDKRIENVKGRVDGATSITSLEMIMKYFINPSNKDTMFVDFDEHSNINGDISGTRNVADYYVLNSILEKLKEQNGNFVHTYSFGSVETERFLKNNVYNFLQVCPKEYLLHPKCPDEILKSMAEGKYNDIGVKNIDIVERTNENEKKLSNPSFYANFNKKEGPVLATIIMNAKNIPGANSAEIANIFFDGLKMREANRNGLEYVRENMYNSAKYNGPIGQHKPRALLFTDVSYETLLFVRDNYKLLTKGLMPTLTLTAEKSQLKKDLIEIQERITDVINQKKFVMSKNNEKTELTNVISDKSPANTRLSQEALMMADMLNVPDYDVKGYTIDRDDDEEEVKTGYNPKVQEFGREPEEVR